MGTPIPPLIVEGTGRGYGVTALSSVSCVFAGHWTILDGSGGRAEWRYEWRCESVVCVCVCVCVCSTIIMCVFACVGVY